jgi:hypothetical protein
MQGKNLKGKLMKPSVGTQLPCLRYHSNNEIAKPTPKPSSIDEKTEYTKR